MIAERNTIKATTNVNARKNNSTKKRRKAPVRHRSSSGLWLKKIGTKLRHLPASSYWIGGLAAILIYVWLFYSFFVSPFGFRWKALFGEPVYPSDYEIHGIDISHYQGVVNWRELRKAMIARCPVRFVMIKATEGAGHTDRMFKENFFQARENGFIRGAYHFWSNKTSPREQAAYFLQQVPLEKGDLPPVLDVEHIPADVSVEDFQRDVLTWLHIVEDKYHVKPIIYTYYKFKEKYLSDRRFDDYPYWIAHYYVEKIEYQGKWKFWQHTDAGRLPGIKGFVDLNIYNGSYYDLRRLTIGASSSTGVPILDDGTED